MEGVGGSGAASALGQGAGLGARGLAPRLLRASQSLWPRQLSLGRSLCTHCRQPAATEQQELGKLPPHPHPEPPHSTPMMHGTCTRASPGWGCTGQQAALPSPTTMHAAGEHRDTDVSNTGTAMS